MTGPCLSLSPLRSHGLFSLVWMDTYLHDQYQKQDRRIDANDKLEKGRYFEENVPLRSVIRDPKMEKRVTPQNFVAQGDYCSVLAVTYIYATGFSYASSSEGNSQTS